MDKPPGWYPDPDGTPRQARWWDGSAWTAQTRAVTTPGAAVDPTSTPAPPPARPPVAPPDSPWSRPGPGSPTAPPARSGTPAPPPVPPSGRPAGPADIMEQGSERAGRLPWRRDDDDGRTAVPAPTTSTQRRALLWIGGGAAALLTLGLVVVVVLTSLGTLGRDDRGGVGPFGAGASTGPSKPPLAQLCPPPSAAAPEGQAGPPAPPGPRVADAESGISYARQGRPWQTWTTTWTAGDLEVDYKTGYFFVTEPSYQPGRDYLASVLSGNVPATVGDSLDLDLKCTGRQVAEDVRRSYYPQPNTKEPIRDEQVTLGGRPAWVSTFRLSFVEEGLKAGSELVGVVLVDVGRPEAAVLYLSIPDTHKQYDPIVDQVIASVRTA